MDCGGDTGQAEGCHLGSWRDQVLLPVPEEGDCPSHEQDRAIGEAGGRNQPTTLQKTSDGLEWWWWWRGKTGKDESLKCERKGHGWCLEEGGGRR